MSFNKVVLLHFVFLLLFGSVQSISAQVNDTLVYLPEVEILQSRNSIFNTGRQEVVIDSFLLVTSVSRNLGDLLAAGSDVFVKTYGGGGSATISVRGTEARHTSVLWNGFNINSASLGVADIANIPGCSADEVKLIKGGSSAVNGNAAIGGTLILSNTPVKFERQFYSTLSGELGSFENQNFFTKTVFSNKIIASSTKLFSNYAKNDFSFINHTKKEAPEEELSNSESGYYGFIQDFAFKVTPNQFIDASVWYQVTNRSIPPIMNVPVSAAKQRDSILRTFVGYKILFPNSILSIKGAFFNEYQFYSDTIQGLDLKYKVTNYQSEAEYLFQLNKKTRLNSGIHYSNAVADIEEYKQTRSRYEVAAFSNLIAEPFKDWIFNFNIRLEQVSYKNPPLSPSLGLKGNLYKNIIFVTGKTGRNFSLPSLNDLYWVPGGNVDLKPEDSWSYETGLIIFENIKHLPVVRLVGFGSEVKNWIKWQPGAGGIYTPENLSRVSTRGIEASVKYKKQFKVSKIEYTTSYSYISSHYKDSDEPYSSNIINKQLTYVPIHSWNSILYFTHLNTSFQINHTYTGERFTTSDNSKSLPGFYVINVHLEQQFNISNMVLTAFFGVNNITDNNYEVIAYRPTPGRWFNGGIKIKFNYLKEK